MSVYKPVHQSKYVQHSGNIGMIMTRSLLQIFKSLFTERNSNLISPLGSILNNKVMKGP